MQYNKRQLKMGVRVEMEHTDNPKVAERIAKDHLREYPTYYTSLNKMERDLKAKKKDKEKGNWIDNVQIPSIKF